LVLHPTIDRAGASPDAIVGTGLAELKCPKTATHLGYMLAGEVPTKYQPQMLWQMACAEAEYNDFVSFDPRLPHHLQLFVVRMKRDDERIKAMEDEVRLFLHEVDELLAKLQAFELKKAA
jgi:hypothetical protein